MVDNKTTYELKQALLDYAQDTVGRQEIQAAIEIASEAHSGYTRLEGCPYIDHALRVAKIITDWKAPAFLVAAAILHDVHSPNYTKTPVHQELKAKGVKEEVLDLLNASTQISKFGRSYSAKDQSGESGSIDRSPSEFPVIAKSLSKTPLVFLIRVANHLDNGKSWRYTPEYEKPSFARLGLDILAPISSRLGMMKVKRELEDTALEILHPDQFNTLQKRYSLSGAEEELSETIQKITCSQYWRTHWNIGCAPTSLNSIYRQWARQGLAMDNLPRANDAFPILITTDTEEECAIALMAAHSSGKPIAGTFQDYIAAPKNNGYKALHTKVKMGDGYDCTIIIRSKQMHEIAENGLIKLWQNENTIKTLELIPKTDSSYIIAFTPAGEPKRLPEGSTPVDFAYHIHSDLGSKCLGATVNGKNHELDKALPEFSTVKIEVEHGLVGPKTSWLNSVKTSRAISEITSYYEIEEFDPLIDEGRDILNKAIKNLSLEISHQQLLENLENHRKKLNTKKQDLFRAIARGEIHAQTLAEEILSVQSTKSQLQSISGVTDKPSYTLTAAEGPLFKGREEELKRLYKITCEKGWPLLLWGPRRIGKTSILKRFPNWLEDESVVPIFIDLLNVGKITTVSDILIEVLRLLDIQISKKEFKQNPLGFFKQRVNQKIPPGKKVLLLVDEFQAYSDLHDSEVTKDALAQFLRHELQHEKKINLVLSGGGILKRLTRNQTLSSVLEICRQMELGYLNRVDAQSAIVEYPAIHDQVVIDSILSLTSSADASSNHPGFVHLICSELQLAAHGSGPISKETYEQWISKNLHMLGEQYFNNLWGFTMGLDEQERDQCKAVISALAILDPKSKGLSARRLQKSKLTEVVSEGQILLSLNRLVDMRSITKAAEETYRIPLPIVAIWLQRNYPSLEWIVEQAKNESGK